MKCRNQNLTKILRLLSASLIIQCIFLDAAPQAFQANLDKNLVFVNPAEDPEGQKPEAKVNSIKIEATVGLYLLNLYDVNTASGSFDADFWLWFNYKPDKNTNPLKTREFLNGKSIQSSNSDTEDKSEVTWAIEKIKGKFTQDFDVSEFPYDRHELHLIIEESLKESSDFIYIADPINSKIDESARRLNGWRVKDLKIEVKDHQYSSNFGDPSKKEGASYNQLVAKIIIEREAEGLLMKVLFGLFIAMAISFISFFIKTDTGDTFGSRVSLLVGMIFAILLSKQAAEAVVGESSSASIIGKLHNIGFAYIFIMIFLTLYSRHISESSSQGESEGKSVKFDRITLGALLSSFVVINYLIITPMGAVPPL